MNVIIRFVSLVLIAAGFAGCAVSPMTGYPGYGEYPVGYVHRQPDFPRVDTIPARYYVATKTPGGINFLVDQAIAYSDPSQLPQGVIVAYERQDGKWVINGGLVPNRVISIKNPRMIYGYQPGIPTGLGIAPFPGMSASLATLILADIDKGENPCAPATQAKNVTAFGFITGLATFALTGSAGAGFGVGLLGSLGASNNSNWSCDLHKRFRWSLLATIDAGQPLCLDTLTQSRVDGKSHEAIMRQCAVVEQRNFRRIDEVAVAPAAAPASAPVPLDRETRARLRDVTPEKPPK